MSEPKIHIVKPGECLSKIAQSYGMKTSELAALNGIRDIDKINQGQELIINPATEEQETGLDVVDIKGTAAVESETNKSIQQTPHSTNQAAAQTGTQTQIKRKTPVVYEVKKGDSLSKIAQEYGISLEHLRLYNGIEDANKINIGQKITIPLEYTTEEIQNKIRVKAKELGIDESLALAIADLESSFDPYAGSEKGAKGIFQLMDKTAAALGVTNSYDVDQNINGGLTYLKQMLQKENNDVKRALIAYNVGSSKFHKKLESPEYKGKTIDEIDRLITDNKNGKGYAANVLELQKKYQT